MNKEKIIEWIKAQKAYAKFAWTVVVIIGSLLGYNITISVTDKETGENVLPKSCECETDYKPLIR